MKKRLFAILIALILLCTSLPLTAVSVAAESRVVEVGSLVFTIYEDNTAYLDYCKGATGEVNVPATVEGCPVVCIKNRVFIGNAGITHLYFPDSVTFVGEDVALGTAFYEEESNWENGVLYIGRHVVAVKKELSDRCEIKEGTLTIAKDAFRDCKNLTEVVLPEGLTIIGHWAFSGCTNLKWVVIPASVTLIGDNAFVRCDSLANVYYRGTKEQWNAITISVMNEELNAAQWHDKHALTPDMLVIVYLVAGVVVLIGAIVAVLLILSKKKKSAE